VSHAYKVQDIEMLYTPYDRAMCLVFGTKFCGPEVMGSTPNKCVREAPAADIENFHQYSTMSLEVGNGAREDVS